MSEMFFCKQSFVELAANGVYGEVYWNKRVMLWHVGRWVLRRWFSRFLLWSRSSSYKSSPCCKMHWRSEVCSAATPSAPTTTMMSCFEWRSSWFSAKKHSSWMIINYHRYWRILGQCTGDSCQVYKQHRYCTGIEVWKLKLAWMHWKRSRQNV